MTHAHDEICNLLYRYTEAIDAGNFDALADLFSSALLRNSDGSVLASTREEMTSHWQRRIVLYDGVPRTRHLTVNPIICINESAGTATARSAYVVFQAVAGAPLQPIIFGRYHDEFGRGAGGRWAFTCRQYFADGLGDLSRHVAGVIQ